MPWQQAYVFHFGGSRNTFPDCRMAVCTALLPTVGYRHPHTVQRLKTLSNNSMCSASVVSKVSRQECYGCLYCSSSHYSILPPSHSTKTKDISERQHALRFGGSRNTFSDCCLHFPSPYYSISPPSHLNNDEKCI
jgi:hypothetical protein